MNQTSKPNQTNEPNPSNDAWKQALEAFLNAFRESETVVRYQNAKELYIADGKLISLVNQYNVQGQLLRDEGAKETRDDELIAQITEKLKGLYDEIQGNPRMQALQQAENDVSLMIDDINRGIQSIVQPEADGGCSGNCSSCSACH